MKHTEHAVPRDQLAPHEEMLEEAVSAVCGTNDGPVAMAAFPFSVKVHRVGRGTALILFGDGFAAWDYWTARGYDGRDLSVDPRMALLRADVSHAAIFGPGVMEVLAEYVNDEAVASMVEQEAAG